MCSSWKPSRNFDAVLLLHSSQVSQSAASNNSALNLSIISSLLSSLIANAFIYSFTNSVPIYGLPSDIPVFILPLIPYPLAAPQAIFLKQKSDHITSLLKSLWVAPIIMTSKWLLPFRTTGLL